MVHKAWTAARPWLDYLDLLLAASFGLVFTVLGLVDQANGDALSQAAIALLALLALSVIFERRARERVLATLKGVEAQMNTTVGEVKQTVHELAGDYPYHTRRLGLTWDIREADGSLAVATKKREVRFTRNNVVSINEHHKADGQVAGYEIEGGPVGGPYYKLVRADEFFDGNRKIDLISLRQPYNMGDIMEIVSRRELRDCFTSEPQEYVHLAVSAPTDEVEFTLVWPVAAPPTALSLERRGGRVQIPIDKLQTDSTGRATLSEVIGDPVVGESITLRWNWRLQRV